MKKVFSLIAIFCITLSVSMAAEPAESFQYNEKDITAEFEQLNKIEQYVQNNEGTTLDELQNQNSELVKDLNISAETSSSIAAKELPLGVPAFWWGCVLTIVGVILVYVLTDEDKDQTKKALIGCLVTAGVYVIWWVVVVVALGGSFWF